MGYIKQGSFMLVCGKVTRDAKYMEFDSGARLASFKLRYGRSDEKDETSGENGKAQYIDVNAWRDLADYGRWLEKGDTVVAMGNLMQNSYTDRTGKVQNRWVLNAEFVAAQPKVQFNDLDDGMMKPQDSEEWDYPEALR